MLEWGGVITFVQFFFAVIIGLYFWSLLKKQQGDKVAVRRESRKELNKLEQLRAISLSEPLAEQTRPTRFREIIGQENGLEALRAALCGPNPQHVLIYGPPGVGKTAAARVILEEARENGASPFTTDSRFVEIDATTARFDERGIADPLIGSVHDPIYQGAGAMGQAGIPQPKPGAVTKAHGGVLFIDEIGELHPVQMNKLLKVLEDRMVFLESAYYSEEDPNIPPHIKEIFDKGLPADFRLIGATTRKPADIPAAIRSRCLEVFFRRLTPEEVAKIARNAAGKIGFPLGEKAIDVIKKFAVNGRQAVNIVQIASGLAIAREKSELRAREIEWVVNNGQYSPRPEKKASEEPRIGIVNGLAVYGPNLGILLEVEAATVPAREDRGEVQLTGVIEEEEFGDAMTGHRVRRKSLVRASVENVLTMLRRSTDIDPGRRDLHLNFPGGIPIDGPSAGLTLAVAVYSAVKELPVDGYTAMTGEISLNGRIKAVGGITAKIEAAREAGVRRVLIPEENWQMLMNDVDDLEICPVGNIDEVLSLSIWDERDDGETDETAQRAGCEVQAVEVVSGMQRLDSDDS